MARVRVETWRSTYAGVVLASDLASLFPERIAEQWRRGLFSAQRSEAGIFVAEVMGGQIVGIAIRGRPEADDPENARQLRILYVLPEF
jgi:hypothetical protein